MGRRSTNARWKKYSAMALLMAMVLLPIFGCGEAKPHSPTLEETQAQAAVEAARKEADQERIRREAEEQRRAAAERSEGQAWSWLYLATAVGSVAVLAALVGGTAMGARTRADSEDQSDSHKPVSA